ncbi:DUF443 family protein [Oceanobacillus iheyensis]|uniref:DUF443 family protein n=1 Tax=Oceanobacillus iheyensis TaxID=182710 RepID=UPI0036388CDA
MYCKVQGVYMNLRYRILIIENEKYIIDMGHSFWKILIPFLYWILPHTAYKVDDNNIIKKLEAPEVRQIKGIWDGMLAGGIGVLLANLLQPLVNYFEIPTTPLVNLIIVSIAFMLILTVFFYINFKFQKRLCRIVNLEHYSEQHLWIRPRSYKHFFSVVLIYLICSVFTVFPFIGFILEGNAFILFVGIFFLFFLLLFSSLTVPVGQTTLKFKEDDVGI